MKELAQLGRRVDKLTTKAEAAAVTLRQARAEVGAAEDRFRTLAAELVGSNGKAA